MSQTLRFTLRAFTSPLRNDALKLWPVVLSQTSRTLYAKSNMGIDSFEEQQQQTKKQMENIQQKFRERMITYTNEESTSMIFTEDLKNMIHLAENENDFDLVIKMAKKFNGQNKQLRFGNFVFGPVVMRMFYTFGQPDLALQCFKDPALDGFFDQLISFQILLDLLYINSKYQEMLDVFAIIKDKQLQEAKYPRNAIVLVMAACYKLNSVESIDYALKLWNELMDAGHVPMRRATTFCAGLALNQGKPEAALEILSAVNKPNYVTIRNIKVKALSQLGRLEEAILVLKSVLAEDQPAELIQTFNKDVVESLKEQVLKSDNPEVTLEFNRIEKLLEKEGHLTDNTLESHLCAEIQRSKFSQNDNRQVNRFSRFKPDRDQYRNRGNVYNRAPRRPGLSDMV